MSDTTADRRRFHRIGFDAPASITQGERTWTTQSQDISLKGVLLRKPQDWPAQPSGAYQVRVDLGADAEVVMQEVILKRTDDEHLGFACEHINLESISHLRRLVELNLGDPALLERELAALGGEPGLDAT